MKYQIVAHLFTGDIIESEPAEFDSSELSLARESLKTIFTTNLTSIDVERNGQLTVVPTNSINYISIVPELESK